MVLKGKRVLEDGGLNGESRKSLKIANSSNVATLNQVSKLADNLSNVASPRRANFELKHDYSAQNVPPQVALDHQLCPLLRMKAVGSLG